jgi:uncharacterized protein (TIGR04551 family)
MRAPHLAFPILLTIALPSFALAKTGSSTATEALKDELREQIKEELRQELVEEIKAEVKTELAAEGTVGAAAQEDTWAEEEWKWEEPVKPELNFFELDGYFRFRYDLFKNLALDLYHPETGTGPFSGGAPPVPICTTDVPGAGEGRETACASSRGPGNTLAGANMRLRLEPILNVSEDIKLKMQIDLLDNVILGSTPDGFPKSDGVPLVAFSQTQLPPSDETNAVLDSIRVKRVWAEIMTPLGQLRVGRMGSHFGLGVLANEGQGLDSDYGDSNDRILFATKLAGHYIVPAFDWAVSGPTSAFHGQPQGQPFDREQRDDVDQYILAIVKRDKEQEIKEKLENDEMVLNYGTYLVHRVQVLDAATFYSDGDPNDGAETSELVVRDAKAYIGSLWFKFLYRKLLIELEAVGIVGSVQNSVVSGTFGERDDKFDIESYGGAIKAEYKLLHDALTIHFLMAFASGDPQPGWGVKPLPNPDPKPGDWDGAQQGDGKIQNFRFDPDFHVDLIFWRQLVGMVTDAWVIRPGVQYNLTEGFGGRLDFVYSRALWAGSTPSGSFSYGASDDDPLTNQKFEPNPNLGLEADLKLFYASEDGFHAWLEYGLFFPFAGLDRRVQTAQPAVNLSSGIAQTIQVLFGVTF